MAGKVVGMLRKEITLEEFREGYRKKTVAVPVPANKIASTQLSSIEAKLISARLERLGYGFIFSSVVTFFVGLPLSLSNWGIIGGSAVCVGSFFICGVGLRFLKKQDKLEDEIRKAKPKRSILPSPVAQLEVRGKNSKNQLGSILESSEVEPLAQSLTKLLGSVSASSLGASAKYEAKRITEDSNSLIGMVYELAEYDAEAAKEQLVKGLQLLNRDAQALADNEKALITQRLQSHNSYMETRSLSA